MYKLRQFISRLNEIFWNFRMVIEVQSIDISIVFFKGRSTLKQYNLKRSIKRELELWCIADISGYIYAFYVYQGN